MLFTKGFLSADCRRRNEHRLDANLNFKWQRRLIYVLQPLQVNLLPRSTSKAVVTSSRLSVNNQHQAEGAAVLLNISLLRFLEWYFVVGGLPNRKSCSFHPPLLLQRITNSGPVNETTKEFIYIVKSCFCSGCCCTFINCLPPTTILK